MGREAASYAGGRGRAAQVRAHCRGRPWSSARRALMTQKAGRSAHRGALGLASPALCPGGPWGSGSCSTCVRAWSPPASAWRRPRCTTDTDRSASWPTPLRSRGATRRPATTLAEWRRARPGSAPRDVPAPTPRVPVPPHGGRRWPPPRVAEPATPLRLPRPPFEPLRVLRAVSDLLDAPAGRLARDRLRLLPADPAGARPRRGPRRAQTAAPLSMAPARRRRTRALAGAACATTMALVAGEVMRVWRRGQAPTPTRPREVLRGGGIAARETVQVVRAGYRAGPANEASALNLFVAFGATFAVARGVTLAIRRGRGPFRNVRVGRRHIHHFVPGIVLTLLSGGASIGLRHERLDHWLAVPFGAGAALIVDETALLIELDDVYWSDKGVLSIDVGLGAIAMLASLALLVRVVRRGEAAILTPW